MRETLKHCPFCGGSDLKLGVEGDLGFGYCVTCPCGVMIATNRDNPAEVADLWNRRICGIGEI